MSSGDITFSFLLLFLIYAQVPAVLTYLDKSNFLHGVQFEMYRRVGDINIGALSITYNMDGYTTVCSYEESFFSDNFDSTESIAFAVDYVNRDPGLLPNVTLGFVQRGICDQSPDSALATSLLFLPRAEEVCNDNHCFLQANISSASMWDSQDVIGLVTPGRNELTAMVSPLFSIARITMIGATEISDEFSDKEKHPYFFRIVPPGKYMIKAMLRFLSIYRLTYISVMYQEGYESNYETLKDLSSQYGVCIASRHLIITKTSDYNQLVHHLLQYPQARALVMFVDLWNYINILYAVKNIGARGQFIYLSGNLIVNYYGNTIMTVLEPEDFKGSFVFNHYYKYVSEYYKYLGKQDMNTTENPWLRAYLQNCVPEWCGRNNILKSTDFRTSREANLRIDAVLAFAHAAHDLLSNECPEARGEDARRCVEGDLLRKYLKNISFKGFNDYIQFDNNQERHGKFTVGQMIYAEANYPFIKRSGGHTVNVRNVAVYDTAADEMSFKGAPITWDHLKTVERIVPWTNNSPFPKEVPESICSAPCSVGQYKTKKQVDCCWDCDSCRDNERYVNDSDGYISCMPCPPFLWPDPDSSLTVCIEIPPTYPKSDEPIPVFLITFGLLALVLTVLIIVLYIRYRNERVIKASSIDLSAIQLVGIVMGYSSVIIFQTPPNHVACNILNVLFCMSFALLYCPLLVKTIRIVRIFKSGKTNGRLRFISPRSQIVFSCCLISVQVILCYVTYILFKPGVDRIQPIWNVKVVELSCDFTRGGIALFLGYNILLVFMCSVFAFFVSDLPDNFNESKLISVCVSTTLLIWLTFIPSYYSVHSKSYIRSFLLSTALVFNHSMALALLFAPKVYSAMVSPPQTSSNKSWTLRFLSNRSDNKKSS